MSRNPSFQGHPSDTGILGTPTGVYCAPVRVGAGFTGCCQSGAPDRVRLAPMWGPIGPSSETLFSLNCGVPGFCVPGPESRGKSFDASVTVLPTEGPLVPSGAGSTRSEEVPLPFSSSGAPSAWVPGSGRVPPGRQGCGLSYIKDEEKQHIV